jgi:hypothetical protein
VPRCAALWGPTPVRRLLPLITALGISPIFASGCYADAQMEPQEPEIPSREEVFESERRQQVASEAKVSALKAYQDDVCKPPSDTGWVEETRRRSCRFNSSFAEIEALKELHDSSIGSPDEPRILDRMISVWANIYHDVLRECLQLGIKRSMTVGQVEDAQSSLFKIQKLREKASTEPERLCDQLRTKFPDYRSNSACPGMSLTPVPPPLAVEPSRADAEPAEPQVHPPLAGPARDIRPPWEPPEPAAPTGDSGWF